MPAARTVVLVAALAVVAVVLAGFVAPAAAARQVTTVLSLTGERRYADESALLTVALTQADGTPVAGAGIAVERRLGGDWSIVGTVVTDPTGRAVLSQVVARGRRDNVFRASYAGDATYAPAASADVAVRLLRRPGRVTLDGPREVVDEQEVALAIVWTTAVGQPVEGRVRLELRAGGGGWRRHATVTTDAAGRAEVLVGPPTDTQWRVRAPGLDWVRADTSRVLRLDNVPPGRPVRLPAGAPRPRIDLPPQEPAVGDGPNPVVMRIPAGVWASMTGVSWHAGCPVGRSGLRLVRVNYWDYDGYRRRGELVANAAAAGRMADALAEMYDRGFPIRAMYRVDRFGWSRRLQGGDDYASMAAGNTSAFNCRWVVNRPGVRSPHSWGRSLDLNTWENPYRSRTGLVPNAWWQSRSHPLVAWRSRAHPVVRIMASHGLRWTYGLGDTQHFDAR